MRNVKNNNKEIIKKLADKSFKLNKTRNYILIGTIVFTITTIICIFSLTIGRLEANRLLYVRNAGTTAYTTLERATQEQYQAIKQLPYIKQVGKSIKIAGAKNFDCIVLDHTAWEDMQKPAYTDIHGDYPIKTDETMLSVRSLEDLGILDPAIGMTVSIQMQDLNGSVITKEFTLSGFYTEYVDDMIGLPSGYFSWGALNDFQDVEMTLLIKQNDTISRERIEEMLYQDVAMIDDTQRFIGGNTITQEQIYKLVGGYDIAAVLVVLILCVAFLLIYNILRISSSKDIRQYGLLKVLGATKKQLKQILVRQAIKIAVIGCGIGAFLGSIVSIFIIPGIIAKMYLNGYGGLENCKIFSPFIVIFAVVFGLIIVYIGVISVAGKIAGLAPIRTINAFEENKWYRYSNRKLTLGKKRYSFRLLNMAWRNITKRKTQFFIIVTSVTMGMIVSITSVVILRGTNTVNEIEYENPDFQIMTNMTANTVSAYQEESTFFGLELKNQICEISDIEHLSITAGGYGMLRGQEDTLDFYSDNKGSDSFVVQILNEQNEENLEQFIKANTLQVDIDKVREGSGIILLHYHALSKIQEDKAIQNIGQPITISNMDGGTTTEMTFSGVMDFTLPDFPDLKTTWNSSNIVYFLVSEKGFDKMRLTKQIFRMDLDVACESEPLIKQTLEHLIAQYNKKYVRDTQTSLGIAVNDLRTVFLTSKSDILESKKSSIEANAVVMGSFSCILIFMGIVNYISAMITGLTIRKKEFAVMESMGLTKKQLRQMLIMEGCLYSFVISLQTIFWGNIVWYMFVKIIKNRINYFTFHYPTIPIIISAALLLIICTMIPLIIERRSHKDNLTDRLKLYTD